MKLQTSETTNIQLNSNLNIEFVQLNNLLVTPIIRRFSIIAMSSAHFLKRDIFLKPCIQLFCFFVPLKFG